jgi:hypothetical protein
VVIHDFDLVGTVVMPDKTDAPLVVDPDAVLPKALTLEGLELIAWWNPQTRQFGRGMQLQEFAPCQALDVPEPGHGLAVEKHFRVSTSERTDHASIVFRQTESVKWIRPAGKSGSAD